VRSPCLHTLNPKPRIRGAIKSAEEREEELSARLQESVDLAAYQVLALI